MTNPDKERLDRLLDEAADIILHKSDAETMEFLGDGIIDKLINAIGQPKKNKKETIYDYLLKNKNRLSLLALIRHAITWNYSIKGQVRGSDCFVSPSYYQWFDDGVIFHQGKKPFEGLIGLYQGGKIKFAIAAHDKKPGEKVGPDDLIFIDVEDAENRAKGESIPKTVEGLDRAYAELEAMLYQHEENEVKYQEYLKSNPWVLGAQYSRIDSHNNLDDKNIPDFTGIRVRDSYRDIIEIKQPFLPLFTGGGEFRVEFHRAWDQAERYLDLTRSENDYLYRQKGLNFDNPHCFLILGFNLSEEKVKSLRRKQRMNPAITILTYNDLLAMCKSTIEFVKNLKVLNP